MNFPDIINLVLHLDSYLNQIIIQYGVVTYVILFLIIFLETGVVFAPFLPGDSLIFAIGALAAQGSINVWMLFLVLSAAAILGDTVNYWIGHHIGKRAFSRENSRFLKKEYLETTNKFYEKHGSRTIILARFIPIIRTFAPFVAGIGNMHYKKFLKYNIFGGIAWVALFLFVGYLFGNIPFVKENFSIIIIVIIVVSIIPPIAHLIKSKRQKPRPEPKQE